MKVDEDLSIIFFPELKGINKQGTSVEEKLRLEKELKQHDDFLIVQTSVKMLPLKYQEALSLKYYEQKSIKEISIILNKKERTIKSLLSRGMEKLKDLLQTLQPILILGIYKLYML